MSIKTKCGDAEISSAYQPRRGVIALDITVAGRHLPAAFVDLGALLIDGKALAKEVDEQVKRAAYVKGAEETLKLWNARKRKAAEADDDEGDE